MSVGSQDRKEEQPLESQNPDNARLLAFKLITLSISLIATLLAGEIAARLYYFGWNSFSLTKMNSLAPIGVSGFIKASDDLEVNRELKPNLDTVFMLKKLKTNSMGLRDREYSLKKPPGTYRVAVVGDSYTMPVGTEIEEAYHSILEERLNRESVGRKYEFVNFGFAGYFLTNYLGVIKAKALSYDPDLIIIGFCANNDFDPPPAKALRPYKVKERIYPFFSTSFLSYMVKNSRFVSALQSAFRKNIGSDREGQKKRKTDRSAARMEKKSAYVDGIFGQIAAVAGSRGIPVLIVYLTLQDTGPKKEIAQGLAKKHGFHFLDTTMHAEEKEVRKYIFIPEYDGHANEKAHKILADEIYSYLMAEKLL